MAWGDYNNDGYIDLFITGKNSEGKAFSGLYEFNGDVFQKTGIAFPSRKYSAAAWGDYDNDGNLDIALSGENDNGSVTLRIMRNTRSGFISVNIALPGTRTGSVDWGDYDHDGDIDLLITGETADKKIISRIYRNDRNDTFTDINAGLTGVYLSDAGWGDYDNDGDLDLFLAGCLRIMSRYPKYIEMSVSKKKRRLRQSVVLLFRGQKRSGTPTKYLKSGARLYTTL
ncbi:MAG: VCBS repeat-containing protein [Bacteroidales bacterium]|nr:VCBS repeat-containing protein [Bacteroidales bacterium]